MSSAVALLIYATVLGLFGPRLRRRLSWTDRAPRLGILVWQAATGSVLGAVVLAGLVLVVPMARPSHGLAHLLRACQMKLQSHYGGAIQPVGAYIGLGVAFGVTLWTVSHIVRTLRSTARQRRRHAEMLAILARRHADLDALVIEHDQPLAYCLSGRHPCVVLTTGALERLNERQMAAVLAHERAHLRGRHDLVVNISAAISRAFPAVPLFRHAKAEVTRLIELLADDAAVRGHDRATVAAALATLAGGRAPAAALGAGGGTALARVRRMLVPHRPLSRAAWLIGAFGIALFAALPLALAANPAITAMLEKHCHFPT